jgi:hypothetical protein
MLNAKCIVHNAIYSLLLHASWNAYNVLEEGTYFLKFIVQTNTAARVGAAGTRTGVGTR